MSKKVLLVDDSPLIHNMLGKCLEKNGYEICGNAKNGQEGIELFEKYAPDIIFMDVTMPIMDGIEASRRIRQCSAAAKIIMLTAMGDEEIQNQAKEIGVDVFLKKPFNEFKIISAISKLV